ncbi:phosphohistidine phosphatase [Bifidobacterium goeldii]|uniref:Phosphohistidine phosphatase n=1 Tax=Bifidobacterium goeldii TaxID=2306975 RepID=A0A430FLQ2_9BIFI|nr:histidine phosphatase family protein [Bifidobacterium goeldii]RSX53796.1 phosphohistidine phosphatase [Bifidobacterium goeldii]
MAVKLGKIAKSAKAFDHVLIVMRHAKTEPFNSGGDIAREITDKGAKQAKTVSKGLVDMRLVPDRIVCSSATRARQTLDKMLKTFGDDPKVDYRQSLYDGGMQAIFDELASTRDNNRVLMILGHEPTVSIASQWLASADSDARHLDRLNLGLSPASMVIFGSDVPFSKWQVHEVELLAVLTPKDFD